jgi:hypothetical protein
MGVFKMKKKRGPGNSWRGQSTEYLAESPGARVQNPHSYFFHGIIIMKKIIETIWSVWQSYKYFITHPVEGLQRPRNGGTQEPFNHEKIYADHYCRSVFYNGL